VARVIRDAHVSREGLAYISKPRDVMEHEGNELPVQASIPQLIYQHLPT
jgi:hypothetical protein